MVTKKNFQDERSSTDKSLGEEREKTNRSIANAKDAAEQITDEQVQNHRAETDENTFAARKLADSHSTNSAAVYEERNRADAAAEEERYRVDLAITHERETKHTIESKLLHEERERTDVNLNIERTHTDTVMLTNSEKFSTEVEEHGKTKASLITRDEFSAIVSHDLKNPIGTISSCMEFLLEESVERNLSNDTINWLQLAKRNADSSLRMISDILDMERMAENKLELNSSQQNIKSIITDAAENFVHMAALKNITINSDTVVSGKIFCDRDRILQVLSNLIGNALKFTPKNGDINLKTEWTKDFLTVSVSDNGPGIPEEKSNSIFEKFAQLKSKDRTGLGLGLHIAKMLVEAHKGNLSVDSKVGIGSTFSFRLPRLEALRANDYLEV